MSSVERLKDRLETLYCADTNLSNEYSQVWDEINSFVKDIETDFEIYEHNIKAIEERHEIGVKRSQMLCNFLKDKGYSDGEIVRIIQLRCEM